MVGFIVVLRYLETRTRYRRPNGWMLNLVGMFKWWFVI